MSSSKNGVITLGGGCFWCLDAVFTDIKGVEQVLSGYSEGRGAAPSGIATRHSMNKVLRC